MTLSDDNGGDLMLGDSVTVTAIVPGSLGGVDFDLWACPDQTLFPRHNQDDNGECFGPNIQDQSGESTTFTLDEDYSGFCNWYIIVHDYPLGEHSNWIGPLLGVDGCENTPPGGGTSSEPRSIPTLSHLGVLILSVLLAGSGWLLGFGGRRRGRS